MIQPDDDNYLGKLVGNTGDPNNLTIAFRDSFSARRGEFVRIAHQERRNDFRAYPIYFTFEYHVQPGVGRRNK